MQLPWHQTKAGTYLPVDNKIFTRHLDFVQFLASRSGGSALQIFYFFAKFIAEGAINEQRNENRFTKTDRMIESLAMVHRFPEDLLTLVAYLKKLPGVGTRTAERFAFEFLSWEPSQLKALGKTLTDLQEKVPPCPTCGCLICQGICRFCNNRDKTSLCLLASARDAYAIEETGHYHGLYHVIEHLLSPLDGRHTNTLRLDRIEKRVEENKVRELIIAFDSTLEGDTTALYLKNHLHRPDLSISRLAFGLPMGSSLEYIDGGTLSRALSGRQIY